MKNYLLENGFYLVKDEQYYYSCEDTVNESCIIFKNDKLHSVKSRLFFNSNSGGVGFIVDESLEPDKYVRDCNLPVSYFHLVVEIIKNYEKYETELFEKYLDALKYLNQKISPALGYFMYNICLGSNAFLEDRSEECFKRFLVVRKYYNIKNPRAPWITILMDSITGDLHFLCGGTYEPIFAIIIDKETFDIETVFENYEDVFSTI